MVYTEFVSSDALIRSVSKTEQKLNISDEERPVAIQIYGKDTDTMVEAARIVEQAHPDILDINFRLPVNAWLVKEPVRECCRISPRCWR